MDPKQVLRWSSGLPKGLAGGGLKCVPSGRCGTPVRREARLPRGQVNRLQGPALTGAPLSSFSTVVSFAKPSSFVDILFRKESLR